MTGPGPSRRSVKLEDWPPIDQLAWRAALRPGDLLDPGGVATRWAEATRQMIVEGYGHWLTWLTLQGSSIPWRSPPCGSPRGHVRQCGGNWSVVSGSHRSGGSGWDLSRLWLGSCHRQLGHRLDLHVAVLELPFVVGLEQHRTDQPCY